MGDNTGIEWTGKTWNPLLGCRAVSGGCANCYAVSMAARFGKPGQPFEGLTKKTSKGSRWSGEGKVQLQKFADPLRWQKGTKIFVCSMSDLFFEAFPFEQIAAVFGIMALAQRHTFQVLTKRPERMLEFMSWLAEHENPAQACIGYALDQFRDDERELARIERAMRTFDGTWPLPNVWVGISVEDQAAADTRIPLLLQFPATVHWLSMEPLLGPVSLGGALDEIGWVVVGGESASKARRRPMDLNWARSLRDQCVERGIPFFFKQIGGSPGNKGGKEKALLDGREWKQWPEGMGLSGSTEVA